MGRPGDEAREVRAANCKLSGCEVREGLLLVLDALGLLAPALRVGAAAAAATSHGQRISVGRLAGRPCFIVLGPGGAQCDGSVEQRLLA